MSTYSVRSESKPLNGDRLSIGTGKFREACLTCPVFITTPEFLPQHREQLELTRGIIERAQQRGQLRLVEMNQRTADNLTKIIDSLDSDAVTADPSGCDAC